MIPYNPLAGGFLTGKHARTAPPPEGRFSLGRAGSMYQERYWHDREFDTVEALRRLADEAGMTLATLAVSWVLAHPAITSAIVGASRPEQLADSVTAADKALEPALKDQLDALTTEYRYGDAAAGRHGRRRSIGCGCGSTSPCWPTWPPPPTTPSPAAA